MRNSSTNFGNHNSTGGRLLACPRFTCKPRFMKFVTRTYSNEATNSGERMISKNSILFLRGSFISVHVTPMFLENREGYSKKEIVKYHNTDTNIAINGYVHNCARFRNKVNFCFKTFEMFGEHSDDFVLILNKLDGIYSLKIQNDFKVFIQRMTGTKIGFAKDYKCKAVVDYFSTQNQNGLLLHPVDKPPNRSLVKFDASYLKHVHRITQNSTSNNLMIKSSIPAALAKYFKSSNFTIGRNQMLSTGDLDIRERSSAICSSISRNQIFSPLINFYLYVKYLSICNSQGKNSEIVNAEKYFKKDNMPHFADRSDVSTQQDVRVTMNSNKTFRHGSNIFERKIENFAHFFLSEHLIWLFQQQMYITWQVINGSISVVSQSESRKLRIKSSLDSLENHFLLRYCERQSKRKDNIGSDRGGKIFILDLLVSLMLSSTLFLILFSIIFYRFFCYPNNK